MPSSCCVVNALLSAANWPSVFAWKPRLSAIIFLSGPWITTIFKGELESMANLVSYKQLWIASSPVIAWNASCLECLSFRKTIRMQNRFWSIIYSASCLLRVGSVANCNLRALFPCGWVSAGSFDPIMIGSSKTGQHGFLQKSLRPKTAELDHSKCRMFKIVWWSFTVLLELWENLFAVLSFS